MSSSAAASDTANRSHLVEAASGRPGGVQLHGGHRSVPRPEDLTAYDTAAYGDAVAEIYDQLHTDRLGNADEIVDFLSELAGRGRVLELGIGTGRIALPLAARGAEVWGIDSSERIVEQMRAKPDAAGVSVVIGDFADVDVPGDFELIFVAFNTFFLLYEQSEQVRCLENVAQHLKPGGRFLVEAMLPDESLYDRGQRIHVHDVREGQVWLEAARYERRTQQLSSQNVILSKGGVAFFPARLRFVSPAELDLMARLAGLSFEDRYGGWRREPFGNQSFTHISIYRRPLD